MSEYRIEKERQPVSLTTAGGERLEGDIFVQLVSRRGHGRELPVDILNDDEPFFALALESGDTYLVAKDNVRELLYVTDGDGDDSEELARLTSPVASVELVLSGDQVVVGTMFLEVTSDRPRLLDYLNRASARFLVLHTDEGVRCVNRRLIERVRPLD